MLESISFTFNGISSDNMGVMIANADGGLYEEIFLPTRNIIEEKTPYNDISYYMGVELEPLTFPITLFIKEWKDRNNLRQIARWLFQPSYRSITFESNPEQIYYVMFMGESNKIHNGCKDGYVTLNVRTNSPFSYSPTRFLDFAVNGQKKIYINNDGDLDVFPRLTITKTASNGDIVIKNSANSKNVVISDITMNEKIEIDFKTKEIISSLENQGIQRYDNHNKVLLELLEGENELIFEGNFEVKMEYELMYLTEDYPIYFG